MYSRLLVPLDGSRLSEAILPYAHSVAKALHVKVELLQVVDLKAVTSLYDPEVGLYVDIVEADMKKNSSRYLDAIASSLADLTVSPSVEMGNPAEIIIERASAQPGTLIAMSTHGRSGLQRWVLGSVADKVLHACTNPLLLVRSAADGQATGAATLKTIVVPLDGSPLAELALPDILNLAKKMMLEVDLVRVYDPMVHGHIPNMDRIAAKIREEARVYLEQKVEQIRAEGHEKISYHLLQGSAAGEIIEIARATPDNLVAMCTHGRSGIGRWVLGSVTDRVVRHSGDPVLVIRAPTPGK